MSAATTLRRAAALMREEHGPDHKRHEMWSAIADRLDTAAWQWEQIDRYNATPVPTAGRKTTAHLEDDLAVAHAYLGAPR